MRTVGSITIGAAFGLAMSGYLLAAVALFIAGAAAVWVAG